MNTNSIPKIIHYCWFGKKEKPKIVKKCINSWRSILTEYEIIEWNEENFDIDSNSFVKEAYKKEKYAFVSDYVRVYVLYNFGGIYLDTDVEVIKSFDNLLYNESFWGFEEKNYIATSTIGAKAKNELIKLFLDEYNGRKFLFNNEEDDTPTNVSLITKIFENNGVKLNGKHQCIRNVATIYPQEYFSPYDYINCYMKNGKNTYSVHHYYKSWLPVSTRIKTSIKKSMAFIIGGKNIAKFREVFSKN